MSNKGKTKDALIDDLIDALACMTTREPRTYRIYFGDQQHAIVTDAQYYVHVILRESRENEYIAVDSSHEFTLSDIARFAVKVRQKRTPEPIALWRLVTTIDDPADLFDEDACREAIALLAKETGLENWAKIKQWIRNGNKEKARRYLEKRFPWSRDMSSDMWNHFMTFVITQ